MATSAPIPQQQAGPAPAQGGPAVVQIISGIARLSDMLKQVFPPAAPMADEIQNQIMQIQQKLSAATSPSQPSAPPI